MSWAGQVNPDTPSLRLMYNLHICLKLNEPVLCANSCCGNSPEQLMVNLQLPLLYARLMSCAGVVCSKDQCCCTYSSWVNIDWAVTSPNCLNPNPNLYSLAWRPWGQEENVVFTVNGPLFGLMCQILLSYMKWAMLVEIFCTAMTEPLFISPCFDSLTVFPSILMYTDWGRAFFGGWGSETLIGSKVICAGGLNLENFKGK